MRSNPLKAIVLSVGLFLFLAFSAGSAKNFKPELEGGTEVVSPSENSEVKPSKIDAGEKISKALCGIVTLCNPGTSAFTCSQYLAEMKGLGFEMGLPEGVFDPFLALMKGESSGVLTGNPSALSTCLEYIHKLTCDSPQVVGAYDQGVDPPYLRIGEILRRSPPDTCKMIFR